MNSRWRTTKGRRSLFIALVSLLILVISLGGARLAVTQNSLPSFHLVGNTVMHADRLGLTVDQGLQTGAAWLLDKQQVQNGFEATFQWQISRSDPAVGGDGFAFVIHNADDHPFPDILLGEGRHGLGYQGIPNSLAVEFDTVQTPSAEFLDVGTLGDPNDNHISVQSRGQEPNNANTDFSLGYAPTIPLLADGSVHTAKVAYVPGTLTIFLDDLTSPVLSIPVDLGTTLRLDNGQAWSGLTAATGSRSQAHDILSFSFVKMPEPAPTPTPTPVPPADTEPPTVSWVKPEGIIRFEDRGQSYEAYPATKGTVALEVAVNDNAGIRSVLFERFDEVNQQWVELAIDSAAPYQASVAVNALTMQWNQIRAVAEDTAGNLTHKTLLIFRLNPTIILDRTEGPRGTEVRVWGKGWLAGDVVSIQFAKAGNEVKQTTVDTAGNFTATFTVPTDAAFGEQKVIATTTNGFWQRDAIFKVTEPGRLRVIKALSMASTDLLTGERVSVSFTVKNVGGSTLHLEELAAGARRGSKWNGEEVDFLSDKNITLPPGREHIYNRSGSFDIAGDYFAEPVVKMNGKWGGIENANRVSFKVQVYATIKPPPSLSKVIDSARYRADINNDSGAELRLTDEGIRQLRNGTKDEQIRVANRMAEWLMSQPRWPETADRTRQSISNEIHCHADPIIN